MPAVIWASVQIVIALVGTWLLANLAFHWDYRFYKVGSVLPQALSMQTYLLAMFKVAAYGLFLYAVAQKGPALFFLRHRGGETVEAPSPTVPPEDIHPTGSMLALPADQLDKTDFAATILQSTSYTFMVAGFFQTIVGGQRIASQAGQIPDIAARMQLAGWLAFGEGLVLLVLGLAAASPVSALRDIKQRGPEAFSVLGALVGKLILLTFAALALVAGAIILRIVKG